MSRTSPINPLAEMWPKNISIEECGFGKFLKTRGSENSSAVAYCFSEGDLSKEKRYALMSSDSCKPSKLPLMPFHHSKFQFSSVNKIPTLRLLRAVLKLSSS
ncbi:MAG: hypothetical protein CMQ78_08670 [Gammaproteobacteria bacterium]|nr:hypothetical protein [Gammaproteobacteria bacterium]